MEGNQKKEAKPWMWVLVGVQALVLAALIGFVIYAQFERSEVTERTLMIVDKWMESDVQGGGRTAGSTYTTHSFFVSTSEDTFETSREIYSRLEKGRTYRVEVGGPHSRIVLTFILGIAEKLS